MNGKSDMLSPKTQCNLHQCQYFEEHLCVGDYYSESEQVTGLWVGKGAEQLNLAGKVKRDDFLSLCDPAGPTDKTGRILPSTRWPESIHCHRFANLVGDSQVELSRSVLSFRLRA